MTRTKIIARGSHLHKILRLVCCGLVLYPQFALATSIPGFNGTVNPVPQLATIVPTLPNKGGPPVNIPGFYNQTVGSPLTNQLPVLKNPTASIPGISSIQTDPSQNKETIYQTQANVIIDWASFDIGANAWVYFNQQGNSTWVALNRIWDANPTYIFGKLTADGRIYLINQNGILFGPSSQVNVNTLVASALNIKNTDFLSNNLNFYVETGSTINDIDASGKINPNYYNGISFAPNAAVSNFGNIATTADGGSIFLIAPRVENGGTINAPLGQIGLVAATNVLLFPPDQSDTSRLGYYYVIVDQSGYANPPSSTIDPGQTFGKAVNWQGGNLYGDGGMVGMYGNNVENWGIIRSTTAFQNQKGQVELKAANNVTTGPNSTISLPVDAAINPATGQVQTVNDTFDIQPTVFIGGLDVLSNGTVVNYRAANQINLQGSITAPAGSVTLMAIERVYLETGSSVDVSGVVAQLPLPVISGFELNSVELRDDYDQKGGVLQGQAITTPVIAGSTIGDLSEAILTQDRTALERSIGGYMRKIATNVNGQEVWVYQSQNGNINISATSGDIIVKQGASLNFSGGAIQYTGGFVDPTMLLSGTTIYNISNAPANLHYDMVLGNYEEVSQRFGVIESFSGLYYGGAVPFKTYVASYTVGGDAGQLFLSAPTIVIDGQLKGGVVQGTDQNTWTMQGSFSNINDYYQALMLSKDSGLEAPRAGTLTIGNSANMLNGGNPMSISIVSQTNPLPESFTSSTSLPSNSPTTLSATTLNYANLGTLNLYANLTISAAQNVTLNLQPGGSFNANARRIDVEGNIIVPGGSISLITAQNYTSSTYYNGSSSNTGQNIPIPGGLPEGIFLGPNSSLNVSGERINNSSTAQTITFGPSLTTGGSITIKDETDAGSGVSIQAGAVVDVSGGYIIDQQGNITGGNGGILSIQGSNIILNGDLRGYALADPEGKILGGSITLTSKEIYVFDHTSTVTDPIAGVFYLADNRFDDTGFTQISLNSVNDLVIGENANISTSLVKQNNPTLPLQTGSAEPVQANPVAGSSVPGRPDLIRLDDSTAFMGGPSSFTANAGIAFDGSGPYYTGNLNLNSNSGATLNISSGAVVGTAPSVASVTRIANDVSVNPSAVTTQISLSSPNVEVAGTLLSPGGNIVVAATNGSLSVEGGAKILAYGYNRPDAASTPKGFSTNYQPVNGGSVVLSASTNLNLSSPSLIDISSSDAVENRMLSADGSVVSFLEAGNPGSLSLTFSNLNGTLQNVVNASHASMAGMQGATLTINRTNTNIGLDVNPQDVQGYIGMGFDDLTFRSMNSLVFNESMDVTLGRKLTLDAPIIQGPGTTGTTVAMSAPWIVLTNTYFPSVTSATPITSGTTLALSSTGWLDVIGAVSFSGFQNVNLKAAQDIRLSEVLYTLNSTDKLGQTLSTNGNLTLDADRIYPSSFYSIANGQSQIYPSIYSDYILNSSGIVTIQHTDSQGNLIAQHSGEPIYSAGGTLTVEGVQGIDVENGYLAAPLGSITFTTQGRIYLGSGSVLTTAGSATVSYLYGGIDSNNVWVTQDKTSSNHLNGGLDDSSTTLFSQNSLPQQGINLNANEVIAMKGSTIDVSGGGSVFAYTFQPGTQGSVDPLTIANCYVVFKNNGFQMPGQAVYLEGGGGLSAGMYTLLPLDANNPQNARYAFMPGAYILELQPSSTTLPGQGSLSADGYPLTIGYSAVAGTSILGTQPEVFSVRLAADVIQTEGNYVSQSMTVGNGGNIGITANTVILDGSINGAALNSNYHGGNLSLNGANIIVQSSASAQLPANFRFGESLASLASNPTGDVIISGDKITGFQEVDIGDVNTGSSVANSITVMAGAQLSADVISLAANKTIVDAAGNTTNPSITINSGAQLTAITGDGEINLTTPGNLLIAGGATLHAANNISLNANNVTDIQGNLQVDNGGLSLTSAEIFFGNRGTSTAAGLYVTKDMSNRFSAPDITFVSKSDIQFLEDTTLSSGRSLTLDAGAILDTNPSGASSVTLNSSTVNLKNSGVTPLNTSLNTGTFTVNASSQINASGDVLFGGFTNLNLNSQNDLIFAGEGSLTTGNGNLTISAARVMTGITTQTVTHSDGTTTTSITAPNFIVNAGTGAITMNGVPGVSAASTPAPGGLLEMDARRIDLSTVLQSDGGTIDLVTKGVSGMNDDGIFLHNGGQILAKGTSTAPGGQVTLATDYLDASGNVQSGQIVLDANSKIDVSAGAQGDAGVISLSAPVGGVTLNGTIVGAAQGNGKGGSFILYTNTIGDITPWNNNLTAGGFSESLDLRARQGDIDVVSGQTVTARNITMTADGGDINVSGTMNASSLDGSGQVELYAQNNVNVNNGGSIIATGTAAGAKGGYVLLDSDSATGFVNINAGSTINVSGNGGPGGTVYLRAQQNSGSDMNLTIAPGSINGASVVYAEAVKTYDISNLTSVQSSNLASWLNDATAFYNSNQTVTRLGSVVNNFHLLPGIELDSSGDINWDTTWDQGNSNGVSTGTRFGGEPGVLTLRAGGNLNIEANLTDHPTPTASLISSQAQPSWGFNLVAGADLSSADFMAVKKGMGDLNLLTDPTNPGGTGTLVYTENAPIRFASGGNTVIGSGDAAGYMINSTMSYNLASFSGPIQGYVGLDLIINGGAIQTATSDININVNRDLQLNYGSGNNLGAIRTTGQLSSSISYPAFVDPLGRTYTQSDQMGTYYWSYDDGGNITLDVGRYVGSLSPSGQWTTALNNNEWDTFNVIRVVFSNNQVKQYGIFSADYIDGTGGLATMGGGNLNVRTGGDFMAQAGTFGAGNLAIYSGGNIMGRFLNENGQGELNAAGNFGSFNQRQQIELFNSQMYVTALGEIQIGAVLNPSLASDKISTYRDQNFIDCTYTPDTSINLTAGTDVTLAGKSPFYNNSSMDSVYERVLPPNVTVSANGNIFLLNDFTLTSSSTGNLNLQAGGDITGSYSQGTANLGKSTILMSDISPNSWYGLSYIGNSGPEKQGGWISSMTADNHGSYNLTNNTFTSTPPVHGSDDEPVEIQANGDIMDISLELPKQANVSAGKDIVNILYEGQNINSTDVSTIQAGNNISMQYMKASITTLNSNEQQPQDGLIQGGPGVFLVQAGGSIDLGSLQDGIQMVGNGSNPALNQQGTGTLIVVSGYTFNKSVADISGFFSNIRTAGDIYAQQMAAGSSIDAASTLSNAEGIISTFLGTSSTPPGTGDINMASSQISTSIWNSDIFVIANGSINLGKTTLTLPSSTVVSNKTGITTSAGGAINVFAEHDVNVNESRIMTFYGGDITVWSDKGSINAGRGARTAVSASPPEPITTNGVTEWVFSPPAIGSGIRAVTYGENAPEPGNIYLFAPTGVINAGEAGVSGGKVVLEATEVLNAQNISFSVGSVGVPSASASQGTAGIGALTGTASAVETSKMSEQAAALTSAKPEVAKAIEDFIAKWVNVEVIGFGSEEGE